MNSRQSQILRVLLSIAIGILVFCAATFLAFLSGVILLGLLQIDFILSFQLAVLFLISSIVGLILAISVGVKYYRDTGKSR